MFFDIKKKEVMGKVAKLKLLGKNCLGCSNSLIGRTLKQHNSCTLTLGRYVIVKSQGTGIV